MAYTSKYRRGATVDDRCSARKRGKPQAVKTKKMVEKKVLLDKPTKVKKSREAIYHS